MPQANINHKPSGGFGQPGSPLDRKEQAMNEKTLGDLAKEQGIDPKTQGQEILKAAEELREAMNEESLDRQ
jgi:hypothetical protein